MIKSKVPSGRTTSLAADFLSMKRTAIFLPTLFLVDLCILAPPSPSKVMFTCGNPLSSYPTFASATLSPEMIIFFSRSILTPLKSKGSFLDLSVRLFASSLNSKLAVLPIIFLASAVSCIPGN